MEFMCTSIRKKVNERVASRTFRDAAKVVTGARFCDSSAVVRLRKNGTNTGPETF